MRIKNGRKLTYTAMLLSLLIITAALLFCGCGDSKNGDESVSESKETEYNTEKPDGTVTDGVTTSKETEPETDETESETSAETEALSPTGYTDLLTGLPAAEEIQNRRPAAIMINNMYRALPQIGIRNADVMYECLVEGGITRLLMLSSYYDTLPTIGSVRSCREYFLDFAQNHNAIYVHAGGSSTAYSEIKSRGINNLDGVNMYLPTTFYRDSERMVNNGYEHSLMTNGERIVDGIEYKKYETEQPEGFKGSFSFVEYGKENVLDGDDAKHVIITYTAVQFPQYIYNSDDNKYYRYQFSGEEHIDGETGDQLCFTNLLILVCPHTSLNDEYLHISVDVTGTGNGYYVYGGKYIPIIWTKNSHEDPMSLTDEKGNVLELNCGKTMINIISPAVKNTLVFNYSKQP